MMHKAWCGIRRGVFQGHPSNFKVTPAKFDPNWAFPDCNSSWNSPMAMKLCTKLKVALKRCPIFFPRSTVKFQGDTWQKIADFHLNWMFSYYTSSLNSLMATKWCIEHSIEVVPYCFSKSSIEFQGHMGKKIDDLNPIWVSSHSQLSDPSDWLVILSYHQRQWALLFHASGH